MEIKLFLWTSQCHGKNSRKTVTLRKLGFHFAIIWSFTLLCSLCCSDVDIAMKRSQFDMYTSILPEQIYTADRLPWFGCQMFAKWPLKLWRIYQTAHQSDVFKALRLYFSKLDPACAIILNQQTFTRHYERFNFSTILIVGLQNRDTFKSDQAQWHSSWSSFLTES